MAAPDTRRYISRVGKTEGPYTVDEIYDMAMARKLDYNAMFWSESTKKWKFMPGLMFDIDPDRLEQFHRDGVKKIRVQGASKTSCRWCTAMVGKVYSIGEPPELPPKNCRCVPWCELVLAPVAD
jgi:hypothetical protein